MRGEFKQLLEFFKPGLNNAVHRQNMENGYVHIAKKDEYMRSKQLLAVAKKSSGNVLAFTKVPRPPKTGIRQVGMLHNITQYLLLRGVR